MDMTKLFRGWIGYAFTLVTVFVWGMVLGVAPTHIARVVVAQGITLAVLVWSAGGTRSALAQLHAATAPKEAPE